MLVVFFRFGLAVAEGRRRLERSDSDVRSLNGIYGN
jgi:hypothetical protein